MNKKIILILVLVLSVVGVGVGYYLQNSQNPEITVSIAGGGDDNHYMEFIGIAYSENGGVSMSDTIKSNITAISNHTQEVVLKLSTEYTEPLNVTCSYNEENGQTFVKYEGLVTTLDGETIDFSEEKIFDFVLNANY
ncbi:MAG: hypothetical protein R3Y12_05185 [Clostridia bacterium]